MSVRILHGDALELLPTLAGLDACVCDPPYHLTSIVKRFGSPNAAPAQFGTDGAFARASRGFMGKQWDGGDIALRSETWALVLKALKPGAHLLAFGGTRTFHRMACAIEDAGFEIRDSISYLYDGGLSGPLLWCFGSGFPKSHNVSRQLDHIRCRCPSHGATSIFAARKGMRDLRQDLVPVEQVSGGAQSDLLAAMQRSAHIQDENGMHKSAPLLLCDVWENGGETSVTEEEAGPNLLQPIVSEQDIRGAVASDSAQGALRMDRGVSGCLHKENEGANKSGMEGRSHLSEAPGQLCERPICEVSARVSEHGAQGRLCDGASSGDGALDWTATTSDRVRASHRPSATQQSDDQPRIVAGQSESQTGGAWPLCDRCGKPRIPEGLGTALKPAFEPIIVARRPLVGTVAQNVLKHGTGAINVDGCRVQFASESDAEGAVTGQGTSDSIYGGGKGLRPLEMGTQAFSPHTAGRWPANLVTDGSDEVLALFPETESGSLTAEQQVNGGFKGALHCYGTAERGGANEYTANSGSAARFFYCAKADADDRAWSKHPTVKPLALMRWLVRLVTPPGGTVLDCFAGSGTTGEAARLEGVNAVLIEREAEYVADIHRRLGRASGDDTPLFADVAAQ